jgi:hypothetical protein
MPNYDKEGNVKFTVKLSEELEDKIKKYATENQRTKSNATIHLMYLGMESDININDMVVKEDDSVTRNPISFSTEYDDIIREIEYYADMEFDGVFSHACRWSIRNGLTVEKVS